MAQISVPFLSGDPDAIKKVPGREEVLDGLASSEKLQFLNLMYVLMTSSNMLS